MPRKSSKAAASPDSAPARRSSSRIAAIPKKPDPPKIKAPKEPQKKSTGGRKGRGRPSTKDEAKTSPPKAPSKRGRGKKRKAEEDAEEEPETKVTKEDEEEVEEAEEAMEDEAAEEEAGPAGDAEKTDAKAAKPVEEEEEEEEEEEDAAPEEKEEEPMATEQKEDKTEEDKEPEAENETESDPEPKEAAAPESNQTPSESQSEITEAPAAPAEPESTPAAAEQAEPITEPAEAPTEQSEQVPSDPVQESPVKESPVKESPVKESPVTTDEPAPATTKDTSSADAPATASTPDATAAPIIPQIHIEAVPETPAEVQAQEPVPEPQEQEPKPQELEPEPMEEEPAEPIMPEPVQEDTSSSVPACVPEQESSPVKELSSPLKESIPEPEMPESEPEMPEPETEMQEPESEIQEPEPKPKIQEPQPELEALSSSIHEPVQAIPIPSVPVSDNTVTQTREEEPLTQEPSEDSTAAACLVKETPLPSSQPETREPTASSSHPTPPPHEPMPQAPLDLPPTDRWWRYWHGDTEPVAEVVSDSPSPSPVFISASPEIIGDDDSDGLEIIASSQSSNSEIVEIVKEKGPQETQSSQNRVGSVEDDVVVVEGGSEPREATGLESDAQERRDHLSGQSEGEEGIRGTEDSFQDISNYSTPDNRYLEASFDDDDSTDAYSEGWLQNQNGSMVVRGTRILSPSQTNGTDESRETDQERFTENSSALNSTWTMPLEAADEKPAAQEPVSSTAPADVPAAVPEVNKVDSVREAEPKSAPPQIDGVNGESHQSPSKVEAAATNQIPVGSA